MDNYRYEAVYAQEHAYTMSFYCLEKKCSQAKDGFVWNWGDINFCQNNHPLFTV